MCNVKVQNRTTENVLIIIITVPKRFPCQVVGSKQRFCSILQQLFDCGKHIVFTLSIFYFQLRLMYEANPMAFIVENAGGLASTGSGRILDVQPSSIHERCPVFLGSSTEVNEIIELYKKHNIQ